MTINDRISILIRELDITQKDFAAKINIKPNTLSMIKSKKRNVTDRVIGDICREFAVNEEWLRTGKGQIFSIDTKSYLDKLVEEYHLTDKDRNILQAFITMDNSKRDLIYQLILAMTDQDGKQ